jgi:hypothetical protein
MPTPAIRPILRARGSPLKTILLPLVVLVVYAFPVAAQDASDAAIQSKIVALEKAWNQAYKAGDAKALDELLDNSIVLINDDGSVQSRIPGQRSCDQLAGATGGARIDARARVRECSRRFRGHAGKGRGERSGLYAARAIRGYVAFQGREMGVHRDGCYANRALESGKRRTMAFAPRLSGVRFHKQRIKNSGVAIVHRPARRCLSAEIHEDGYSQQDDREDPEGRIAHSSFLSHAAILPPI